MGAVLWLFAELFALHGVLSINGLVNIFWIGVILGLVSLSFGRRRL